MKSLRFENGDLMPQIGLGTWKIPQDSAYNATLDAVKMGYRPKGRRAFLLQTATSTAHFRVGAVREHKDLFPARGRNPQQN